MSVFRKSVVKPAPGAGAPKGKNPNATVVWVEDLIKEMFPNPNENGVMLVGNIPLKQNARMERIYMTDVTHKVTHKQEGDADAEGFMKAYEGSHPGDELEINEFIQNSLGEPFIIIYDVDCNTGLKKVVGLPCNPLYLKSEFLDDNTAVKHTLVFEQRRRDRHVSKFYEGELSFAENFNVADAEALALNVANGFVMKLPVSNEVTVVAIATNTLPHKKVVTLIGSGGTNPATLSGGISGPNTVIVDNGLVWEANNGAFINLQVYEGGGVTYLQEISRG